jgi:hypothetical protein
MNEDVRMELKAGPFTFAELQAVTSLGRGEIRECINRGIISAPADVGQGNHRAYSKWNLVEGVIAAALLQHIRAGSVAAMMERLRWLLQASSIDPESFCKAPGTVASWHFNLDFPPRTRPEDKASTPWNEETGVNAFLIATAGSIRPSQGSPPAMLDNPLAAFCHFPIELDQAVRFVNHMVETKL